MRVDDAINQYGIKLVGEYLLGNRQQDFTSESSIKWYRFVDETIEEILADVPQLQHQDETWHDFYDRMFQMISWVYYSPTYNLSYEEMTVDQLSALIGFVILLVENIEYVNDVTVAHRDHLGPLFAELTKPTDEYIVFQLQLGDDNIIRVNQLFGERYNEAIDKYHGVEDTWAVCLELDELDDNVNEHYMWRFRPFEEWLVENGNDTLLTKGE